jgi:hypothetical protein
LLLSLAGSEIAPLLRRLSPPSDAFGRPVLTQTGAPITHGPASSLPLAPVAPSSGGAHPPAAGGDALWSYVGFGNGVGLSGIRTSIGPGPKEIYCGGSTSTFGGNDYWYALRHAPNGNYDLVWSSGSSSAGIRKFEVGDVLPDPGPEIVTLDGAAHVVVRDQDTKAIRAQFDAAAGATGALRLFDMDGDGRQEILLASSNSIYVYSGTGALLFQRSGMGGSDLCVGQMDGDPSLEIATTDGHVLDYDTNTIQCTWTTGFGFRIEAVDFDGDGMDELVFADPWNFVWAFDVDTCLPKWSINNFNTGAMRIADADHDGTPELIIGDAQWGKVHAVDLATQATKWSINNPEHGTTDVWVDDVDGDGQVEVLWGAGATSTGPDRLYVGSAFTQSIEWQNIQLDGPWVGPVMGDVDGDGLNDLVVVSESTDAGYGAPRIVVFDAVTLHVKAISQPTSQNLGWGGVGQVRLHDIDGDGNFEIAIATNTTYDGLIEIYNVSPSGVFTRVWHNNTLPSGVVFQTVEVADLDNSGSLVVLGGVSGATTGSMGTFVYAYSLATGNELWHTFALTPSQSGTISALEVVDSDHDGHREFAALVRGGALWIFDGATHAPEAQIPGPFDDFRTWVRTPAQPPTIVLARSTGNFALYQFHGGVYTNLTDVANPGGAVNGLGIGRGASIAVGQGSQLKLLRPFPNVAWTSAETSPGIGRGTVFQFQQSRLVTTGQLGVFAFQLD